uniref:protein-serine/threonine phosphatase n=1 Tax=Ditylenchus dipsaci TaxID=166011 RepID=A0A915EJH0_9BILA
MATSMPENESIEPRDSANASSSSSTSAATNNTALDTQFGSPDGLSFINSNASSFANSVGYQNTKGGSHATIEFRGRVVDPDAWLADVAKCHYLPESQMITLCNILVNRLAYQSNIAAVSSPATIFFDLMKLFEVGGSVLETNYVFLGDYVDRGYYSLETVTYLFLLLLIHPNKVTLLRAIMRLAEQIWSFGSWSWCCKVFDVLPIAALVDDKVFCVHGGLSPELPTLDAIMTLQRNM